MSDPKSSKKPKKDKKDKKARKEEKKRKRDSSLAGESSSVSPTLKRTTSTKTEPCVLPLLDSALAPNKSTFDSAVWLCRVPNTSDFDLKKVTKFIEGLKPSEFGKMAAGNVLGFGKDNGDGERFELRAGNLSEGGNVMRVLVPDKEGLDGDKGGMKLGRPFAEQVYVCLGDADDE